MTQWRLANYIVVVHVPLSDEAICSSDLFQKVTVYGKAHSLQQFLRELILWLNDVQQCYVVVKKYFKHSSHKWQQISYKQTLLRDQIHKHHTVSEPRRKNQSSESAQKKPRR